jgi:hypothetical protein
LTVGVDRKVTKPPETITTIRTSSGGPRHRRGDAYRAVCEATLAAGLSKG